MTADHGKRATVLLECRSCQRTMRVKPDQTDPPNTAKITNICPECDEGDFAEAFYFNAAGQQIDCDEGLPL